MARKKTQPEQAEALFVERKPRKRAAKPAPATETQAAAPPSPAPVEGTGYVMPEHRRLAVEAWLNTEQDPCVICGVPLLVRDGRILTDDGLAHVPCARAVPPFEFPPLVKRFTNHEVLYLDRPWDSMFRAGYYVGKLYQCGPGNVYGHFGSFGLDEKEALEGLGIETIQIWTKTVAYQITMRKFQEKGEVAQTPPGTRWLVPLEAFQKAERKGG